MADKKRRSAPPDASVPSSSAPPAAPESDLDRMDQQPSKVCGVETSNEHHVILISNCFASAPPPPPPPPLPPLPLQQAAPVLLLVVTLAAVKRQLGALLTTWALQLMKMLRWTSRQPTHPAQRTQQCLQPRLLYKRRRQSRYAFSRPHS